MVDTLKLTMSKSDDFDFPSCRASLEVGDKSFVEVIKNGLILINGTSQSEFLGNETKMKEVPYQSAPLKKLCSLIIRSLKVNKYKSFESLGFERTENVLGDNLTGDIFINNFLQIICKFVVLVPDNISQKVFVEAIRNKVKTEELDDFLHSMYYDMILEKERERIVKEYGADYKKYFNFDEIEDFYVLMYYSTKHKILFRKMSMIKEFTTTDGFLTTKEPSKNIRITVNDRSGLFVEPWGPVWKMKLGANTSDGINYMDTIRKKISARNTGSTLYLTDEQFELLMCEYSQHSTQDYYTYYGVLSIEQAIWMTKKISHYYIVWDNSRFTNKDIHSMIECFDMMPPKGDKFKLATQLAECCIQEMNRQEPYLRDYFTRSKFALMDQKRHTTLSRSRGSEVLEVTEKIITLDDKIDYQHRIKFLIEYMYILEHNRKGLIDPNHSNGLNLVEMTRKIILDGDGIRVVIIKIEGDNTFMSENFKPSWR